MEFWMPKAQKSTDKIYLSLAMLVSVVLLIIILHFCVWTKIAEGGFIESQKAISPMLINPAFLGLILTVLSIGDYYWAKWIKMQFKAKDRTITFFSERKSITIPLHEIAFIESKDTEVCIVTQSGEVYRNKTGIGQWENLLGEDFLRIHRSFLVNIDSVTLISPDTLAVGNTELPVSRKYKERVQLIFASGSSTKE
ncbi:MAG: LytTR family transcriptional regulator [Bacteroidales bacterium]|nr:LytTR family transcriptional regulator [Bacteroidales bacterium]